MIQNTMGSSISPSSASPQLTRAEASILPLLKWPGGKRSLASYIVPHLRGGSHYFEPFLGGAAIFFALKPQSSVLSDINGELIECYQVVRDEPLKLATVLGTMRNSEATFYRIREQEPATAIERAARLIYLTSLSFNGIYRQNLDGKFNVPYGKKTSRTLPSRAELQATSNALRNSDLVQGDFESATTSAKNGDVVYFDPPYTVAHNNNGFVKYNASIFSWSDQERLAEHARVLADLGCKVVISNANHASIRALYPDFRMKIIKRSSVIAARSQFRGKISEALFISAP